MCLTGIIHFVIEGREYSKADSRYASRDPFVVSMEAITAFVEGPLCFLAVWGLFRRSSWRYTVIIVVSLGQLYGDILYFSTTILEVRISSILSQHEAVKQR
eukprot:jgi/Astpho2/7692/Aster-x0330